MSISKNWKRGRYGEVVDDSGKTVLLTGIAMPCGPRNPEAERNTEDMLTAIRYHDRLVEALEAAMDYIDKSPCDPDIFLDQIEAHMKLCDIDPKALLSELSAHNGEGGE